MGVWPGPLSRTIAEIVVLENPASLFHFLLGLGLAPIRGGCARRVFAVFLAYQAVTTLLKTILIGETGAEILDDLVGDTVEYMAGAGLAFLSGLDGRVEPRGLLEDACSWRGIGLGLLVVAVAWTAAVARVLAGGG